MHSAPPSRRILSFALASLHLAFVLGAGAHRGPHVDGVIAELPADLHHHAYGLKTAPPPSDVRFGECLACHLSRMELRLPASGPALVLDTGAATRSAEPASSSPRGATYAAADPRAPPLA